MTTRFTIPRPYDLHVHWRDDDRTALAVPHTVAQCAGAVVMPNLVPPVRTVADVDAYLSRLSPYLTEGFAPMMTLYLTDDTTVEDIAAAAAHPRVVGCKLYPAGATTNSHAGVTDLQALRPVLEAMAERGMVLLAHGEVLAGPGVDIFEKEARWVETQLTWLTQTVPELKISCEHMTSAVMAEFVGSAGPNVGGSVTPQHLLYDRNDLLEGGIKPHLYCLPILKKHTDRAALWRLVKDQHPRVWAGTDSAPHTRGRKECACGCAGCYSAYDMVSLYAEAFDRELGLGASAVQANFREFVAVRGAEFYGMEVSAETLTVVAEPQVVPSHYDLAGGDTVVPLCAGETLGWSVVSE